MLFGWRRRRKSTSGVLHRSDPASRGVAEGQPEQWQTWRRAAQRVSRAWNEWLAADGRDRLELYRRYVGALAEEERAAAALERVLYGGQAQELSAGITAADASGGCHPSYR